MLFPELAERVVDVLHLYPVFGNEPINNHRDLDSGAYVTEAVYLWRSVVSRSRRFLGEGLRSGAVSGSATAVDNHGYISRAPC